MPRRRGRRAAAQPGLRYQDLGPDHVSRLESLGFEVTLAPSPTLDPAGRPASAIPDSDIDNDLVKEP